MAFGMPPNPLHVAAVAHAVKAAQHMQTARALIQRAMPIRVPRMGTPIPRGRVAIVNMPRRPR